MLAGTHVFSVDEELYCWRDVVLAAARRGDWQAAIGRAREGAACAAIAAGSERALAPGEVDAAAREFRYARELVTAESMERWLARRAMSVAEWTAALERTMLRRRDPSSAADYARHYPITDDEAARLALVDVLCSDDVDRWIVALAEAAAVHAHMVSLLNGEPMPEDEASSVVLDELTLRPFGREDADALRSSVRRLDRLDAAAPRFRAVVLTERALRDHVNARRIDWVRIHCRVMRFREAGMAAEAALMLRDDGESFTVVSQVARATEDRARFFLDEVDELQREAFLGARAGDVIGPFMVDGEHRLYEIDEKILPALENADVRARAEQEVLKKARRQLAEQRVRWLVR